MLEILNRERDTDRSLVLGVTGGTLRLDPIALYDSTENEFIASAFRAETSVKGLLASFATVFSISPNTQNRRSPALIPKQPVFSAV